MLISSSEGGPLTDPRVISSSKRFWVGFADTLGRRESMEDASVPLPSSSLPATAPHLLRFYILSPKIIIFHPLCLFHPSFLFTLLPFSFWHPEPSSSNSFLVSIRHLYVQHLFCCLLRSLRSLSGRIRFSQSFLFSSPPPTPPPPPPPPSSVYSAPSRSKILLTFLSLRLQQSLKGRIRFSLFFFSFSS